MYTYEKKRRGYWQFRTCTLCAKTIYLFLFIQHVFVKKEIINKKKEPVLRKSSLAEPLI